MNATDDDRGLRTQVHPTADPKRWMVTRDGAVIGYAVEVEVRISGRNKTRFVIEGASGRFPTKWAAARQLVLTYRGPL